MEGELREKVMDTNTDDSPGYQSQPNSLEPHLMGKWYWTPTGAEPMERWTDGWMEIK